MATIHDLPEELIEYIFLHLSPYGELQVVKLVSHHWNRLARGAVDRLKLLFLRWSAFEWSLLQPPESIKHANIAERCSHAACYHDATGSMFVFGGCTAAYTTFNDLWKFDLATRCWSRPLPMGTYPTPKACATMVEYGDVLVLFGGWSKSSPNPIHQTAMFFNELHTYNPFTNYWTQIFTGDPVCAPHLAGHSASIADDRMIIFGGSHGSGSTNNVWIFDFSGSSWSIPPTSSPRPLPRYGQCQIKIDETHILIVGGCGGPNLIFTDVWLLIIPTIEEEMLGVESGEPAVWRWEEIRVENPALAAPQLWSHPACRVGDQVIVLSKPPRGSPYGPHLYREMSASSGGHASDEDTGPRALSNSRRRQSGDASALSRRGREWVPPQGNLVPPRRRLLISSRSLDEKEPPPSPKPGDSGLSGGRTFGELTRAQSIPAIIVGEIPSVVVTHDPNDSGSSDGSSDGSGASALAKAVGGGGAGGAISPQLPGTSAAARTADLQQATAMVIGGDQPGPLDAHGRGAGPIDGRHNQRANIGQGAASHAQQQQNPKCIAMIESSLLPNQATPVDPPPNLHQPNRETSGGAITRSIRSSVTASSTQMTSNASTSRSDPHDLSLIGASAGPSSSSPSASSGATPSTSSSTSSPPHQAKMVRNTVYPSVRPNATKNRARQLEILRRMEEYIRARSCAGESNHPSHSGGSSGSSSASTSPTAIRFRPSSPPPRSGAKDARQYQHSSRNPMAMYALDISRVISERTAQWSVDADSSSGAPEDTILYSLVRGRAELVLFGGMRSSMPGDGPANLDVTPFSHCITNETYIIRPHIMLQ